MKRTTAEIFGTVLAGIAAVGLALAGILMILIWKKDKTRRVSFLRFFIGFVSVLAIYYLFIFPIWVLVVLILIFFATIITGRFFCGWICPFGLYMDFFAVVRKSLGIDYWLLPERLNKSLDLLRYVILAVILVVPFVIGPPYLLLMTLALFFLGPFKPLIILLGPLEPLIVPFNGTVAFNGWTTLSYPYVRTIQFYTSSSPALLTSSLAWVFIGLTVATSFMVRRFWCRFCPTGSTIAILNKFKLFKWAPLLHIDKDEEKCTKCGVCKRVCPLQVTQVYDEKGGNVTPSTCMLCFRCVEMCPYKDTLKIEMAGKPVFRSRDWLEPAKND
jgi:ferredoxin-type protein NapH